MPETEEIDPLVSALESLFLKHPELLDPYLVSLNVMRTLREGPIFDKHKRNADYVERLALSGGDQIEHIN